MIAIIHGSTCGATYSFLHKPRINGDFGAFEQYFDNRTKLFWWANALDKLNFWQCFNPINLIKIYQTDKKYTQSSKAQAKLAEFLTQNKPQIIIAHSAGCDYLTRFLRQKTPTTQKENQEETKNKLQTDQNWQNLESSEKQKIKLKSYSKKQIENEDLAGNAESESLVCEVNSLQKTLQNLRQIHFISSDWQIQGNFCTAIEIKIKKGELVIYNYFCPLDLTLWISFLVNRRIPDGLFGSSSKFVKNKIFVPFCFNFHTYLPNNSRFASKIHKALE